MKKPYLTDKAYTKFATDRAFNKREARKYRALARGSTKEAARWERKGNPENARDCRAEAAQFLRLARDAERGA